MSAPSKANGFHTLEHMPSIRIGSFTIRRFTDHSVWIERDDGEGGEFFDAMLEEVLSDFYNRMF